ncbi:ArnT family glycosyltransferase [Verrucomicrobiota bacterium]
MRKLLPLLLMAAIAAVLLYRTPYNASNLEIVPDSVEYAVAAHRLVSQGSYTIAVNNHQLPPRYQPWFSSLILAPGYILFGPELGNAIFPITCLAVIAVLTAFMIGSMISGNWGGFCAAIFIALLPAFRYYGAQIMTDVPCATFMLLTCLLFIKLRRQYIPITWACAGILIGLSIALRPASFFVILPFLIFAVPYRSPRRALASIVFLLLPCLAVITGTMVYNSNIFGSPFRTGYNFWCSVPYDHFAITFSSSHLPTNLMELLISGLPALILVVIALSFINKRTNQTEPRKIISTPERDHAQRSILEFAVLSTGPIIILHLFYFFADERFFLPASCLLAVLCGSIIGLWLARISQRVLLITQIILFAAVCLFRCLVPQAIPSRRIIADTIINSTPDNALIISSIDPVYLEFTAQRRVLPLSRCVEYASKVISPEKKLYPDPLPEDWKDYRRNDLLKAGAIDVFPLVVAEQPWAINSLLKQNYPVYLETGHVHESDQSLISALRERFRFIRITDNLYQLSPHPYKKNK